MIPDSKVWAILPAAGHSRRMGAPKLALPCDRSTIAGTVVRTLMSTDLAGVVVVTRREIVERLDLPRDQRLIVCLFESHEMIDSIRHGLQILENAHVSSSAELQQVEGILVMPADMPSVAASAIQTCLEAFAADPQRIILATQSGRAGHPIIFPFSLRHDLVHMQNGLGELRKLHPNLVTFAEVPDDGIGADIDTWDEYAALAETTKARQFHSHRK